MPELEKQRDRAQALVEFSVLAVDISTQGDNFLCRWLNFSLYILFVDRNVNAFGGVQAQNSVIDL